MTSPAVGDKFKEKGTISGPDSGYGFLCLLVYSYDIIAINNYAGYPVTTGCPFRDMVKTGGIFDRCIDAVPVIITGKNKWQLPD